MIVSQCTIRKYTRTSDVENTGIIIDVFSDP